MAATGNPLLSLPEELLTAIVMNLSLTDVLEMRATCRVFHRVCEDQQVWRPLFVRSVGVSVPRPFFLTKPLDECSSRDLEHALRTWRGSWLPTTPLQQFTHVVPADAFQGRILLTQTLTILPGGRWIIGACDDCSVWYFDLADDWTSTCPIEPKLLIPEYTDDSGSREQFILNVWLTFDWTSPEALGGSAETHHLTQFNLALFIRPWRQEHAHIDVWQVRIQEGSKMLGAHLSSFREQARVQELSFISLYGGSFAYKLHVLVVVDWREANGRTKDKALSCRCLFEDATSVESLYLLPGNRLLVFKNDASLEIYNWASDFPLSDLIASDASFREVLPSPVWKHKWAGVITVEMGMQQPSIVGDSIRMILYTKGTVHGLTIKLDDYTPAGVQLRTLLKDEMGCFSFHDKAFGLNRAVGVRRNRAEDLFYAQFNWSDGDVEEVHPTTGICVVPSPLVASQGEHPTDFFYDLFTQRVVTVPLDLEEVQFCTVFAPRRLDE